MKNNQKSRDRWRKKKKILKRRNFYTFRYIADKTMRVIVYVFETFRKVVCKAIRNESHFGIFRDACRCHLTERYGDDDESDVRFRCATNNRRDAEDGGLRSVLTKRRPCGAFE